MISIPKGYIILPVLIDTFFYAGLGNIKICANRSLFNSSVSAVPFICSFTGLLNRVNPVASELGTMQ